MARHVTSRHVRRVERVETTVSSQSSSSCRACRAVLFDELDTAKMHGLERAVSCPGVTRWAKWNLGFYSLPKYSKSRQEGNSPDKLRHTRSVAYSVEPVVLNKYQISGGRAYLDCCLNGKPLLLLFFFEIRKKRNFVITHAMQNRPQSRTALSQLYRDRQSETPFMARRLPCTWTGISVGQTPRHCLSRSQYMTCDSQPGWSWKWAYRQCLCHVSFGVLQLHVKTQASSRLQAELRRVRSVRLDRHACGYYKSTQNHIVTDSDTRSRI